MEVIIVFVCFMIAPALIIYSLVRILTGNMAAKPTRSDGMEYNAFYLLLIGIACVYFGDLFFSKQRVDACFELPKWSETTLEQCIENSQYGIIDEIKYIINQ